MWTFITSISLNLELMIDYTQWYKKYLLSWKSSSLYGVLYKPSDLAGLLNTTLEVCWFSPLFLTCGRGLQDLNRVCSLELFPKLPFFYIWPCTLTSVFYWLPYRMVSYFFTINYAGSIQTLVAHDPFKILSRKEINTHVLHR